MMNSASNFNVIREICYELSEQELKKFVTKATGRNFERNGSKLGEKRREELVQIAIQDGDFCDVENSLKEIGREDLVHLLRNRSRNDATTDVLEEYLQKCTFKVANSSTTCSTINRKRGKKEDVTKERKRQRRDVACTEQIRDSVIKPRSTCDLKLYIKAELDNNETVLRQHVESRNPDPVGNQLECFSQATGVLCTRDLGSLICQVQFAEITFLDAFWRDYLNGSLAEAMKKIFLTQTLRRGVNNEEIRLFVHLRTQDYLNARNILVKNLD